MMIISKFRDYYDSAASFGVDKTQVLNRKQTTSIILRNKLHQDVQNLIKEQYIHSHSFGSDTRVMIQTGILFFCGVIKPYLKINTDTKKGGKNIEENFTCFSLEELEKFLKRSFPKVLESSAWLGKRKKDFYWGYDLSQQGVDDFFNKPANINSLLDIAHSEKVAYFSLNSGETNSQVVMSSYPDLKSINFQKQIDAHTCFQEIQMFYFGVLGGVGAETIEIDDKYKVAGKGFDTQYGFRTRPKD
jgi:hypothetical protein